MGESRFKNALLWLVAVGFFMETLDATIVNTALPTMAHDLGVSPLSMQSVIVAYSLTLAVLIPASGWIADRLGTRRVFFSAIAIFTLGSLCCSLSKSLPEIVLARVLQGTGGSMMLPVGRLAVLRAYPGEKYLNALAFISMPALVGPMIGPSLGGWLVQYASWHWIFLVNLPVGLIGCVATYLTMPAGQSIPKRSFDGRGFALLSLAMVSISMGLDGFAELGFSALAVGALAAFSAGCLIGYVLHARREATALFPLSLFGIPTYRIGIIGNLISRMGSSGMPFLLPLYLQLRLHDRPLVAGVSMIPIAVAAILAKRVVPGLIRSLGYKRFLIYNTLVLGATVASCTLISTGEPMVLRLAQLFLFGIVNSMQFTAMNTVTLKDLDQKINGAGSTMFSMVQMVAMSFGVAIAGVILVSFRTHLGLGNAFVATFITLGVVTCLSSVVFGKIPPELAGSKLQQQDVPRGRSHKLAKRIVVRWRATRILAARRR